MQDANASLRAELERSEERYRSLIEGSIQGILIHVDGIIRLANPALARLLGYDDPSGFVGRSIWPFIVPEDREGVEVRMKARQRGEPTPSRFEVRAVKRGGATAWIECIATRIAWDGECAILLAMLDVTEKRELEEQFRQAQKMEAVGRLAGGVAHDFNNLLTAISSFSDLLLEDLPTDDRRREDVNAIRQAAQTGATLTRQLLTFSRQRVLAPRVLLLNDVVQANEKMLKRLLDEDIELALSLDGDAGWVRADAGALEQVLMNLTVNARDAMPDGGTLMIATVGIELDENFARDHFAAQPGRYVILMVSDTGIGMDEATRARVFEPFFTTKAAGIGTGLGLSTVYAIVRRHGGFIHLSSTPGRGTAFEIFLPRVEPGGLEAGVTTTPELPRGSETLLLVEDAAAVRASMCEVLGRLGYTVLEAPDGESALSIAAKHHGPIDLLVTDLVMPRMGGRRLVDHLLALRPELRVLVMTGYNEDDVARRGGIAPGAAFLQKPFTMERLAQRVRAALDPR